MNHMYYVAYMNRVVTWLQYLHCNPRTLIYNAIYLPVYVLTATLLGFAPFDIKLFDQR